MKRETDIIKKVISNEGGYVKHPSDPGGETKYGISSKQYPDLDIKELTKEDAIRIYTEDYWAKYKYNLIRDDSLAFKVLDMAVNLGPITANRLLQEAINTLGGTLVVDGIFGPKTLREVNSFDPTTLENVLRHLQEKRYLYLVVYNPELKVFLKGWMKRAKK